MHADHTLRSIDSTAESAHDGAPVLWSRSSGLLASVGNADAELKTHVSDGDAEAFRRLARELGMTTSGLLRVLVLTRIHGVAGLARMTRQQLACAAGEGPELAHDRPAA